MHFPINTNPVPSCADCGFLDVCHGLPGADFHVGCFKRCNEQCRRNGCDMVCPTNAIVFGEMVAEIGGFSNLPKGALLPPQFSKNLPFYIPQIYHGGSRAAPLAESIVSIPLYQIIAYNRRNIVRVKFSSPETLRAHFRLSPTTKFIISSVGPDRHIEAFWSQHQRLLPEIAVLRPYAMTVPNFSFMLDVPRTNNLYNLGRIFRTAERMTKHEIPTILHLNAQTAFDWEQWLEVMKEQSGMQMVSLEFQTGASFKAFGDSYFSQLEALQENLGRSLHPIVLAGGGRLKQLSTSFDSFTVIDSDPFLRAMNRSTLRKWGNKWKWRIERTAGGKTLESLLSNNISEQRKRFGEIISFARDNHQIPLNIITPAA